jgi:hypothetical protein
MRIVVVIAASALVAACSSTAPNDAGQSRQASTSTLTTTRTATPTTPKTSATPAPLAKAPVAGTAIADVIRWIESGAPAEVTGYHLATRAGVTTHIDPDIAFAGPSGTPNCMTDAHFDGALACLVDLADPPPQPADVYGQWKGGWVDFEGPSAEIGSAHGDPGRFGNGAGPVLPFGETLAFGDYRCRADQSGTYCVNYAHQSAVKFAESGVETFGCLAKVMPPPTDVGRKFSC